MTLPLNQAEIAKTPENSVTAITVAYNSAHALPGCIASLKVNGISRIIVVDNASTDTSTAVAEANGATVVRCPQNQGFGRANNLGISHATTDYCLLLNPDVTLDPGAVATLLEAARRYPEAMLLGPQIVEADGRVFFQPRALLSGFLPNPSGVLRLPTSEASVPFLSGACYLVKREAFLDMGGFDPNIFLFYEDDDLCRRISDAGQPPLYVPAAIVRHGRGKSTTTKTNAERAAYQYKVRWHMAWSRFYVLQKYNLPELAELSRWQWRFRLKILVAQLLRDKLKQARYRGSLDGARAFAQGQTALQKESLN